MIRRQRRQRSSRTTTTTTFTKKRSSLLLINFLPALLVWPVWLTIGLRGGSGSENNSNNLLQYVFVEYWAMMIAMIIGSMIAGSTPLGGGVVAFPVAVLVLGLNPSDGRDFSLFIQSIGLTAATFLVFTRKSHLLKGLSNLLAASCFFSVIGVIIGFQLTVSPFIVNLVYTTTVASFAIILAYVNYINNNHHHKNENNINMKSSSTSSNSDSDDADDNRQKKKSQLLLTVGETFDTNIISSFSSSSSDDVDVESSRNGKSDKSEAQKEEEESTTRVGDIISSEDVVTTDHVADDHNIASDHDDIVPMDNLCRWIAVSISGFLGGILSSQIGSGADITFYVLGSVYLNTTIQRRRRENSTQRSYQQQQNDNTVATTATTRTVNTISANSLTAISVIIMAITSVFGTILRVTTIGSNAPTTSTYMLWLSCAWIVVVGAPIGSLFLTPSKQEFLKRLFYVLALLQLIIFGTLKIHSNTRAWAGVAGTISITIIFVGMHYVIVERKKKNRSG